MKYKSWFKKAWNTGIPIADDYSMNHHQKEPTLPQVGNRLVYDNNPMGENDRKPATGEGNYPKNISLTDKDKDERLDPGSGRDQISPGTTILDNELPPTEHNHGEKFVSPEDSPKMTDQRLPKSINGRLKSRVPITIR